MALNADHSDKPQGDSRAWPPDATPRFGHLLAQAWAEQNQVEYEKPTRLGTRLRVSGAGQCARMTGYRALGVPKTEPTTLSGYWRMGLGTMVHSLLEPVMEKAFPGAKIEYEIDYREHEQFPLDLSGSGDVSLRYIVGAPELAEPPFDDAAEFKRVVVEWKTINGYGFQLMTGVKKGFGGVDETGPKPNHIVQAAIEGYHQDADEVVLGYLSLECLSAASAKKIGADDIGKFIAEFTLARDRFVPIAEAELRRLQKIMVILGEGGLPPRSMPDLPPHARIVDPATGRWEFRRTRTDTGKEDIIEAGEHWQCPDYCDWKSRCIADGPT